MSVQVECRGEALQGAAPMLTKVIETLLARTAERDPDLDLEDLELIVVAEDYTLALAQLSGGEAVGGEGVVRAIHREESVTMLLDGRHMSAALAGDAEAVAAFVHLFHRELCRIHDARVRLGRAEGLAALLDCEFDRQLLPIAESMWAEYFSTRRSVWSLPASSDLMLNHLADLNDAFPPSMQEEIALHLAANDLDALFARSLGRITHLLQTIAHCQGYLAGLGRPLSQLSPELEQMLVKGFLAEAWPQTGEVLDQLYRGEARSAEALYAALLPQIQTVFAALGQRIRRAEDGGVWLDPIPMFGVTPMQ
ncbi:MAG: hypothetical protein KF909_05610 [Rhodocyclaceae bacterium]|nr:hypothetical protein [Rhodocyclaceae bacterium]